MPILHVYDVPESLYCRLQQHAAMHHRSLNADIVALLEQALANEVLLDQTEILMRMRCNRRSFRPADVGAPDSFLLLREDRER